MGHSRIAIVGHNPCPRKGEEPERKHYLQQKKSHRCSMPFGRSSDLNSCSNLVLVQPERLVGSTSDSDIPTVDVMLTFLYPSAVEDANHISYGAQCAKVARHSDCASCSCQGLHPQPDWQAVADDSDDANDVLAAAAENNDTLTDEGFLTVCACGHGVEDHGCDTVPEEFGRRAALAVQIDALLEARWA